MSNDVCTVDLTDAPVLRAILTACRDGGLSDSQTERIWYRAEIIDSLTRVIAQSTDPVRIERANWTIEEKKHEVRAIISEEASLHPEVAAGHAVGNEFPNGEADTRPRLSMADIAALPRS